jgi:hypothetical protein
VVVVAKKRMWRGIELTRASDFSANFLRLAYLSLSINHVIPALQIKSTNLRHFRNWQ